MRISRIFGRRLSSALLVAGLMLTVNFDAQAQATQTAPAATPLRYETHARQQQIDNTISEDNTVLEIIAPYKANIQDKMNAVIGTAPEVINKEGFAAGRLGMLITDIIRQTAANSSGRKIDLAIMNIHGIRSNEIPAGQITVGSIYRLMPFENEVAIIEMSGTDLMAFFEVMAGNAGNVDMAAVSGAQFSVKNGKLASIKIGDCPLDMQATYTVGIHDYLYNRGGEYSILQRGKNYKVVGMTLRDAIINYIRAENAAGRQLIAPATARVIVE